MPILRGAATFARFRVEPESEAKTNWKKSLAPGLKVHGFEPLDRAAEPERSAGFAELEDPDAKEFSAGALYHGEYALFTWRVDEFRIPASQVKGELERWAKGFEKEHGRPPGRKEKKDAKAEARHTLKKRAPIATKLSDVSWNLPKAELQVWAGSRKAIDEVQAAVEQTFRVKLVPIVPVTVAAQLGIGERGLAPTPALSLPDAKLEVAHG